MKYSLLAALALASICAHATDDQTNYSFTEALQNGDTTLNLSVGYFNRGFDDPGVEDAEALTAGGIIKYQTWLCRC